MTFFAKGRVVRCERYGLSADFGDCDALCIKCEMRDMLTV